MALIDLIVHRYDRLTHWRWGTVQQYGIALILGELEKAGHRWRVVRGPTDKVVERGDFGDVAIMHADCTFVPTEYLELSRHYPICLNAGCADISKRRVSRALLADHPGWTGPVIVKSNHNAKGQLEAGHNRRAWRCLAPPPHPGHRATGEYRVFEGAGAVPLDLREDPRLVCEIFVPERHGALIGSRSWFFCGKHSAAFLRLGQNEIVRGGNIEAMRGVDVPDLHAQRRALALDFGKFDYVMHEGRPLLLDVAKTSAGPPRDRRFSVYALDLERVARALARALGID